MKFRKECPHGKYDPHFFGTGEVDFKTDWCPGGVFLPDWGAETVDWCIQHKLIGEGPDHCEDGDPDAPRSDWCRMVEALLVLPEIDGQTP